MELKVTFLQQVWKEWKNVSLLIKTHENFYSYSLFILYNILKAHEDDVKETANEKEKDKSTFGGPLALSSKSNIKDGASDEDEGNGEEGVLLNYNGEAMAYYLNNNAKKFYKKPMKGNFKNNRYHKNASTMNYGGQSKDGDSSLKNNISSENV